MSTTLTASVVEPTRTTTPRSRDGARAGRRGRRTWGASTITMYKVARRQPQTQRSQSSTRAGSKTSQLQLLQAQSRWGSSAHASGQSRRNKLQDQPAPPCRCPRQDLSSQPTEGPLYPGWDRALGQADLHLLGPWQGNHRQEHLLDLTVQHLLGLTLVGWLLLGALPVPFQWATNLQKIQ